MTDRSTAIARGVAVQVGGRVLAVLVALITVAISTRYLGVDGYGIVTATIVFVGLFEAFTDLGIAEVIVRRTGQGKGNLRHLAGVNYGFSVVLGPVAAVVSAGLGLLIYQGQPELQLAIVIVSSGLIFHALASVADPVFQTKVRFGAKAVADLVSRVIALGATVAVAAADLGVVAMAATQAIHPIVRAIICLSAAQRMERFRARFTLRESGSLVWESLPLTAMIIVAVLYHRSDGFMLSVMATAADVAVYGLALNIVGNLAVLPQVFAHSAMSTLAERRFSDPPGFAAATRTGYQVMLVFALPVAVLGWPLAGEAITLISTPEFAEQGTLVLQLFLVATAVSFLNPLLSTALFSCRRQRFLLIMALVTLAVNIALNLVLIPAYGAAGAAASVIASHVLGAVCSTYVLYREGAPPPSLIDIGRILPGLLLALAVLVLLDDLHLLIRAPIAGVVYVVLVIALRGMPPSVIASLLRRGPGGRHRAGEGRAAFVAPPTP